MACTVTVLNVGSEEFVVSGECVRGLGVGSMGKNYCFLKIFQVE